MRRYIGLVVAAVALFAATFASAQIYRPGFRPGFQFLNAKITRGLNVGHAWTPTYEVSGGNSFGRLVRIRVKSHVGFQCYRVVFMTTWIAGTSATFLYDQEWPAPLNIQAAVEAPPYTSARTGIPTGRQQVTWNGSGQSANSGLTFAYGGTGTNITGTQGGMAVSDRMCLPSTIPADTYFGVWASVEPPTSQPLTYSITSLTSSGTTATATMASTAGLYVNEVFNVSGASVSGYNNQYGAILSVTSTQITYTTSASNLASATTATGVPQFLPANLVSSGALERYEGTTAATSSSGSFVATNAVANATSLTSFNTGATGVNAGFAPAFLLIDYSPNDSVVVNLGDSTEFGVSAGGATNVVARDGDSMGDADHAITWMDRGVFQVNNKNFINAGKGSDGAKFLKTPSYWPYRRNAIALMNPTHVINGMAFNDQGSNSGVWTATTAFLRGASVYRSGKAYIQTVSSCISGNTGPVGTTVGASESDGTCIWTLMGATSYSGAQGVGDNMVLNDQLKALLPGVLIYNTPMMPAATSTDNYTTVANQSCTATAQGQRQNFNSWVKSRQDILGWTAVFDPNTYVENSPSTYDCKWIADGLTANLVTVGAHFNGYGNVLGSQAVPAGSFAR